MEQNKKISTKTLTMAAILTAIVFVLQLAAAGIAKAGLFTISLVLVPIVIGAATCGIGIGAWLGFIFGVAVLISGDANLFLGLNFWGTIVTVIAKGTLCGLEAGIVYKAFEGRGKYFAVICSAIATAVTNTGVFLIGCLLFFAGDLMAMANGTPLGLFVVVALIGFNFPLELAINLVLSPMIVRLLKITNK